MESTERTILRVNNVDTVATSEEQLAKIRPLCEELGIDPEELRPQLKQDPEEQQLLKEMFEHIRQYGEAVKAIQNARRKLATLSQQRLADEPQLFG